MLVGALEWRGLQRQLARWRRGDCVYYLVGCCARKSASEDRSGTKLGIQFLRHKESAHVSRGRLLLRMELRSNPEMLCVVRNALGQLAATLGFSEPECNAVVLAVDEALTNIIRHAYLGAAERPFEASSRPIHLPREGQGRDPLEIILEVPFFTVHPQNLTRRT